MAGAAALAVDGRRARLTGLPEAVIEGVLFGLLSPGRSLEPGSLFDDGGPARQDAPLARNLGDYLDDCERAYLLRELARHEWHMGHTAKAIGISRKGLWERLRRLQVDPKGLRDGEA